jgi:cytochrome b involved in lipid metabolism
MEENITETSTPIKSPKLKTGLYIGIGALILIIVGTYFIFGTKKSDIQNQNIAPVQEDSQTDTSKTFTLTEVASHSTKVDCWMAIDGNVYDVSSFVPKHPGEEAILQGCGKDATEMFNTRPNDGTSHSEKARNMLKDLQIGVLAGS